MDHKAVEEILSLLAFAGLAAVGLTWIGALLERLGVGRLGSGIADTVDGAEVILAWLVAVVATSGSLYFSESVGYVPCVLCWFQRIAMYPMVVILLVAIVRRERAVAPYALFLAATGLIVSIYHYQLEWFPDQSSICSRTDSVPCEVVWFKHFGVSTIPFLAGSGFLMIGTLMALAWRNERRAAAGAEPSGDPGAGGGAEAGAGDAGTVEELGADADAGEDEGGSRGLVVGAAIVIALAILGGIVGFLVLEEDTQTAPATTETPVVRPGDPIAGKTVFASAGCGGCHTLAAAGASSTVGPSLDATTLDQAQLRDVIASGRGAMPAFSGSLSPQQIADLAAFIAS